MRYRYVVIGTAAQILIHCRLWIRFHAILGASGGPRIISGVAYVSSFYRLSGIVEYK